jgi:hypothetical protein
MENALRYQIYKVEILLRRNFCFFSPLIFPTISNDILFKKKGCRQGEFSHYIFMLLCELMTRLFLNPMKICLMQKLEFKREK